MTTSFTLWVHCTDASGQTESLSHIFLACDLAKNIFEQNYGNVLSSEFFHLINPLAPGLELMMWHLLVAFVLDALKHSKQA
jgi:hypothetical protein